jgi:hypothetical protein
MTYNGHSSIQATFDDSCPSLEAVRVLSLLPPPLRRP